VHERKFQYYCQKCCSYIRENLYLIGASTKSQEDYCSDSIPFVPTLCISQEKTHRTPIKHRAVYHHCSQKLLCRNQCLLLTDFITKYKEIVEYTDNHQTKQIYTVLSCCLKSIPRILVQEIHYPLIFFSINYRELLHL